MGLKERFAWDIAVLRALSRLFFGEQKEPTLYKNSKSRNSNTDYKGIYYNTSRKTPKYMAGISIRKSEAGVDRIQIGMYKTLQEAITAREQFILNLL